MRRRVLLLALAVLAAAPRAQAQEPVTVMAAASLTDAFKALGEAWVAKGNKPPRFVFAASSTLARQIAQGAPADIFASADEPWADDLQQRGLLQDQTRVSPLGNALVLVAPAGPPAPLALSPGVDLLARLGPNGRLALADPAAVPAGRYAQAAFTSLGVWTQVQPRVAAAANVRAALLLVERGEAPLGVVYATDAAIDPGVQVVGVFPAASHPPITYPFALTRTASPEARALFAFLTGPEAAPTYRRLGFSIRE